MAADKRADIWAFGVVLFEMLTGRQMFSGHTISDTLAAVLRTDPDWSVLPPETPAAIRRLLRRCLERELKRRMCDIGDARLEIEEALVAPPGLSPVAAGPLARGDLRWWFGGSILLALAGAAVAFVHFREAPPERAEVRFQVPAPEKTRFAAVFRLALSPDGRRLTFAGLNAEGRPVLWVRSLDSLDARPLPGTENAVCAFWSPDSRWIGFAAEGKLKKIEASGGQPQTLCNTPPAGGIAGAWNSDGVILFGAVPSGGGLLRVSQAGGEATRATTVDRSETAHAFPQFLPDGRHFIYFALSPEGENTGIYLGTLGGKERKRLLSTMFSAVYSPASANREKGHLLFLRDGTLMAQPLDARTFDLAGEAFPIAEQIGNFLAYGYYSAATNGALAYRSGGRTSANTQLIWFNREGKPLGAVGPLGGYNDLALSRDGKRVAVSQDDPQPGKRDIWLVDMAHGVPQRFTFGPREDWCPVWSPDGRRLFFASRRDGPDNIYQKDSGGTGTDEPLLKSDLAKNPLDWSPDGRFLMYYVEDPKTKADLWILPAGGDRKPMPFLQTPSNETQGQFSPGSEGAPAGAPRWVAYSSDESGAWQIYVQPFPGGTSGRGGKFQVSTGGGLQPRWRADGKELFYIAPDGKLMAVEVKMSPRFETGIPKALFTTRISGGTTSVHVFRYAVAPDGKRFLINTMPQTDEPNASPITVVLNWTAGLKK
jgi:Tol biopolymer transport system component